MDAVERATIRKIIIRLVPFLCFCYFIAYLDRVNVGFAALQMNAALNLNASMFGLGAGLFFIAYFLLELPSNLALDRFGARKWIARIMITWGVISAAFAFIPHISRATGLSTEHTFYVLRFLLGMAEAGFFPGVIFYLTLWFPSVYRARIVSFFMLAIPFSSIVGAPVSGALLNVSGAGLDGWQWLFILEGVPACLVAVVVLLYLTDRPHEATWLSSAERDWLETRLAAERQQKERVAGHFSLGAAIADPRILTLALVYFCLNGGSYGVSYFLPTIVKGFGLTNFMTGVVSALPFVFGAIGMVLLSRHSDHTLERRGHVAFALGMAALGIGLSGFIDNPVLKMALLCFAQIGVSAVPPMFWPIPSSFLTGASAAAGIAIINSLGNLSGFAGPFVMGWLKDATGSFTSGLLCLAVVAALGAVAIMLLRVSPALERAPQTAPISA
ncbi:MAG: MFS transporter [Alphaproteobacteria bacterium]|nr:MFS transporter [Alphaproteobacteria bacterium]